jgi:HD-GYP domain-containing protein (c-di-GMP phosphodiesterase class II)
MKTIKVDELEVGMKFTEPAYVDGDTLLVPPNIPLRGKDLERLKKWEVEEIETEGEIISAKTEALKQNGETGTIIDEILGAQADKDLLYLYSESVEKLEEIYENIRNNEPVEGSDIDRIVNSLVPEVRNKKDEIISFIILRGKGQTSLAKSSLNCMILCVLVAENLKVPNHKIIQIAIAAMLHDIGMMRIPRAIIEKDTKLSNDELKIMRTHPIHSYKIINKTLKYPEETARIALQHHERWDGKGYPKGLSGKEIDLPARIVSVVDAFEAMVSVRPYRNSMIGYKAMRQLLNDNSRRFDSEILKVFIKTMGIYPIGSIVLLNDASIGRVISVHSDSPLRPTLRLIVDSNGNKCVDDDVVINLLEEKNLFITRAINPMEIEQKQGT